MVQPQQPQNGFDFTSIKGYVFGREPVVIGALIQAVLTCAVVFGFNLDPAQSLALLGLSGAILTVLARQAVTPVAAVPPVVVPVADAAGDVEPRQLILDEQPKTPEQP